MPLTAAPQRRKAATENEIRSSTLTQSCGFVHNKMQIPMKPQGISIGQYSLALRALAALGFIVVGLQSPGRLNAQSPNNATYTAAQANAGKNRVLAKLCELPRAEHRRRRIRSTTQRRGFHAEVRRQADR